MNKKVSLGVLIAIGIAACRSEAPTMTEIGVTAGATSTVVEVATDIPNVPTETIAPTATERVKPERVIVVSVPNAGEMESLGGAAQHPMDSGYLATTAVAHNSLAAGRWPAGVGIVGERVHRPEDGIYWYTSGFELPMVGAQPIWRVASDQGLVTAALFWPGASPTLPDQMADYTIGYGQPDAYSELHEFGMVAAGSWSNAPTSFSAMQEGVFAIEGDEGIIATVYALGIDATDDGVASLDRFVLSRDRVVDDGDVEVGIGEWGRWMIDGEIGQGADFIITEASASAIKVFQSRVYRVIAGPEELRQEIIAEWGYFAPEPDYFGLSAGWITAEQYMEMVRRQSDWMMDVTLWVDQTYHPDLMFTVQNPMDQAGHQFMLIDGRQVGYSEERAAEYRGYMDEAAAQADRAVGRLIQGKDAGTAIVVVSPVRLEAIHTRVNVNIALAEVGLLGLGNRGFVIMPRTKAIAFSSGGAAHIYINAVGREEEGIVGEEEVEAVVDQVIEVLSAMVDPQTGEAIFERVVRRSEIESLNGLYAGDVFAQAKIGYALDDETNAEAIFEAVSFYGQEGYTGEGWFSVIGWDIRDSIRIVDIAPSIAWLLNFDLGASDGRSVFED